MIFFITYQLVKICFNPEYTNGLGLPLSVALGPFVIPLLFCPDRILYELGAGVVDDASFLLLLLMLYWAADVLTWNEMIVGI